MAETTGGLYEDAEGHPVLKDSIVLYVDELGTSLALAKLTDKDLRSVVADHQELGWFLHSTDMGELQRSVRFSDNTVVGAPVSGDDDGGAFYQVFSAATYQCNLALRGRFLRGAIARGPLYIGDGYVTGRGLLDAVKLEENEARHPRVLVQRSLWEGLLLESIPYADPFDSAPNRYVVLDADGELFVNYLAVFAEEDYEGAVETGLAEHREAVSEQLNRHSADERIRRKFAWVAQYHNWACSAAFYDQPELMIHGGLDALETAYARQMSLLIPERGLLDGQPGRPPQKP